MAVILFSGKVEVVDLVEGRRIPVVDQTASARGHSQRGRGIAWHNDGVILVSSGEDRRFIEWKLEMDQPAKLVTEEIKPESNVRLVVSKNIATHPHWSMKCTFSPDGKKCAVTCEDAKVGRCGIYSVMRMLLQLLTVYYYLFKHGTHCISCFIMIYYLL